MVITGESADGYLIACDHQEQCRSFAVETLESEIRCPSCGQRETSLDLTKNYVFLQRVTRIARIAKARTPQAARPGNITNNRESMPGNAKRVA